jgi:ATP-binding cassette subfamily B protein
MLWMVWRTVQGLLTLGDLAFFYQAFNQGQSLMRSLLGNVGQIYANSLFLGNLFEFLTLEPQVVDRLPRHDLFLPQSSGRSRTDRRGAIRFEHVTFRYPGSERVALDDFNLTIPAGQVVAIVGSNGAGKSTLVKLLCRFYDPHAGRILLDGIDLRDWPIEELRQMITAIFQEPVHYQDTASANVALGDLAAHPDSAAIVAASRAAWADELISGLPQGYETHLGKWFVKGHELSTGEWQRIALARAFVRRAPLMLFDEPTSAMDSWAEADWLQQFRGVATGRTVVVITHRFTTAMRADIVHVVADGRIVESGHHDELVARGDRYAQSWATQTMSARSVASR